MSYIVSGSVFHGFHSHAPAYVTSTSCKEFCVSAEIYHPFLTFPSFLYVLPPISTSSHFSCSSISHSYPSHAPLTSPHSTSTCAHSEIHHPLPDLPHSPTSSSNPQPLPLLPSSPTSSPSPFPIPSSLPLLSSVLIHHLFLTFHFLLVILVNQSWLSHSSNLPPSNLSSFCSDAPSCFTASQVPFYF